MSFRFNFSLPSQSDVLKNSNIPPAEDQSDSDNESENCLSQCGFISICKEDMKDNWEDISLLKIGDFEIKYVLIRSIKIKTDNETFSQIDALKTDIIPGKYEGGLKMWECSIDLAIYLAENKCIKSGDSVLELGCGAGLPGIVAYLSGAKVTFQDFNSEVLEFVTLPNTLLNTSKDNLSNVSDICDYLYGDWKSIYQKYYSDSTTAKKYDVILTSETIYEKSSQKKLLNLMKSALKQDGIIYIAAKIYYFGVGGGITDFEMLVKDDKTFEISPLQKITEGVERQILMMKFAQK